MAFSQKIAKELWEFAGHCCSDPTCRRPLAEPGSYGALGEAAHIEGEKRGTARFNENQPDEERHAAANGIYLCVYCHRRIDRDEIAFDTPLLHQWKYEAHQDFLAATGFARRPQGYFDTADAFKRAYLFLDRHRPLASAIHDVMFYQTPWFRRAVPDQLRNALAAAEPPMDPLSPRRHDYCHEPMSKAKQAVMVRLVNLIRSSPPLRFALGFTGELDFRTRMDPTLGQVHIDPTVNLLATYLERHQDFEEYLARG